MNWMAWTLPTAVFFAAIALILTAMTVWEFASPSIERRGFLPLKTSRGDRLFIGLLSSAYIHLIWLLMTEAALWPATVCSVVWMAIVMRWG
ncbi:DUF2160 domain-containing protein [Gynuella sunshinyii]|uniref:Putative small integral membrane protein n=1 Tax=Gynuella sunshinyii YC6258 TaxID=1445510 RepID=A0A0C5VHJ2_9GAMM|nr:DUF2160 domain-containing protein [Gynuella sunshinyii]AJQ94142.1 putative small integral membrane protein [Gynuella sunshinyii YC6258]